MLSIDPTKVPLFLSSVCIFIFQVHLLFLPPLLQWQSPLLFTHPARFVDRRIYYELKNCTPPDANIVQDGTHPALFEHVAGSRMNPPVMQSLPWLVLLSHAVGCTDMEPLQLCQCGHL